MKTIRTRPIVKQVAEELEVTQGQVYDIIVSPFELQVISMRNHFDPKSGTFPMVRIPNFGMFVVPLRMQKGLKEYYGFVSDEE